MTFEHLEWLYVVVPLLVAGMIVRFWRRRYWGHPLVPRMRDEVGGPNPILRIPVLMEGAAVAFLIAALLGPFYPFVLNRIERGGLQIMIVLDLSQSMYIPLGERTRMEVVQRSATEFVNRREGDVVGLVVFSHNGYLVTPATFDHDSLLTYLERVSPQTLAHEGYTAIGEGLAAAHDFFLFSRERGDRAHGEVIVLFGDGENNWGRDPLQEVERARQEGIRIYFIGVALEPGAAQDIALAVPATGGKFFDVQNPAHLEEALDEIDTIEEGRFYTLQLTRHEPAYFVFVLLAFAALALRMIFNGMPHFVELS